MNPFQKLLELIATPDQSSKSGVDALALGMLELGAQLDISMTPGSNAVDASMQALRMAGVNPGATKMLSQRLNDLRLRIDRGQN